MAKLVDPDTTALLPLQFTAHSADLAVLGRYYDEKCYEHRRAWVEQRVFELAENFAVDAYAYAAMSNHVYYVPRLERDFLRGISGKGVAAMASVSSPVPQPLPTSLTKPRSRNVVLLPTPSTRQTRLFIGRHRSNLLPPPNPRLHQLRPEYPGRHGNDPVADQDHDRSDELSQRCLRSNVAEANRGHGDYRPVHGVRDA